MSGNEMGVGSVNPQTLILPTSTNVGLDSAFFLDNQVSIKFNI